MMCSYKIRRLGNQIKQENQDNIAEIFKKIPPLLTDTNWQQQNQRKQNTCTAIKNSKTRKMHQVLMETARSASGNDLQWQQGGLQHDDKRALK